MFPTNKKFFDKKNIINNQDANPKPNMKNDQAKNQSSTENILNQKQVLYSKPYMPEDQYQELAEQFKNAKFDVGYQVFQKAFPCRVDLNFISNVPSIQHLNSMNSRFDISSINSEREKIEIQDSYEAKQDCINFFEPQFSTQEQQSNFDQEQSTSENSNNQKERSY